MDKYNRLTRWDEWKTGTTYEWFCKGRGFGYVTFLKANRKKGYVLLSEACEPFKHFRWRNKYRAKTVGDF